MRAGPKVLAAGIVALEFGAAVSRFVVWTLLPVISDDLDARRRLALLVAGSTLGLFVALPLATRAMQIFGGRAVLAAATTAYTGGLIVAATATNAWVFALGQFVGGVASGLLAVFGVSAVIRHLDERLRVKVVALSSAMWILPAIVGPAATVGLEHLIGWRWTLLVPVPIVLVARVLVARSVRDDPVTDEPRPLGRTLLAPLGVAGVVLGSDVWPVVVLGAVVALVGVSGLLLAGTARLARGAPAALAALTLFAIGYFGADSLITVLLTDQYDASLAGAGVVLGAAPLAWGITSLMITRVRDDEVRRRFPVLGLTLSTFGSAAVALGTVVAPEFAVALVGWAVAGVGVGLAYPVLYVRASTPDGGAGAEDLAAAVITAESFGSVLGGAVGGAISSHAGTTGLASAYVLFTIALAAAVLAATRARAPLPP